MLVGVVAFNVLRVLSPEDSRALGVLLIGYFFQGMSSTVMFKSILVSILPFRPRILHDIFLYLHLYSPVRGISLF